MRFVYSPLRFVPDPARGEFINVGVIAGSDEAGEWSLRQASDLSRARALDEEGDLLYSVRTFMDHLEREIDSHGEGEAILDEEWLASLRAEQRGIVQLGPTSVISADEVEAALDFIFPQMVQEAERKRARYTSKGTALARVRQHYRTTFDLHMGEDLFQRTELRTGPYEERMDLAVVNGVPRQLLHSWSFDVADQDRVARQLRAWGWTVERLQKEGGDLEVGEADAARVLAVSKGVDIVIVYVPPGEGRDTHAYEEGKAICSDLQIRMVSMEDTADLEPPR